MNTKTYIYTNTKTTIDVTTQKRVGPSIDVCCNVNRERWHELTWGNMMKRIMLVTLVLLVALLSTGCFRRNENVTDVDTISDDADNIANGARDGKCTIACWNMVDAPNDCTKWETWIDARPGLAVCDCAVKHAIAVCGVVTVTVTN